MEDHVPSRLLVLVVDDDPDTVATQELLVRLWGYDVAVARSGSKALAIAIERQPDVVLLDLAMPGMDGYEVAAALKLLASPALLIAVSGYGQERDVTHCQKAGFRFHFLKPFDPDRLRTVLQQFAAERLHAVTA